MSADLPIDPFEPFRLDRALVCEFFWFFARFEYALKATPPFCICERGRATPDWTGFKNEIGAYLADCDDKILVHSIRYLVNNPPHIQKYEDGRAVFHCVDLQGDNDGEKAIEAVKRVRNNLFHGGKHTRHYPPGRDEKLIRCSLNILKCCIELHRKLRDAFVDLPM